MLALVGLGLHDERDLTLKGLDIAKGADKVYIELYTGKWLGSLESLSKIIGKEITEINRSDLEENSGKILQEAKKENVIILVQGDPLVATTHSSLLLEAKKQKIKTRVIHNASIVSAISESGLHIYKFGPIVTIPFSEKTGGKPPQSVYNAIEENLARGLHTLCLLDVVADEGKYMTVSEGLKFLSGSDVIPKKKFAVLSKVGSEEPNILYGDLGSLTKENTNETPAVIIVLGKLHFTEKEYLELYEV